MQSVSGRPSFTVTSAGQTSYDTRTLCPLNASSLDEPSSIHTPASPSSLERFDSDPKLAPTHFMQSDYYFTPYGPTGLGPNTPNNTQTTQSLQTALASPAYPSFGFGLLPSSTSISSNLSSLGSTFSPSGFRSQLGLGLPSSRSTTSISTAGTVVGPSESFGLSSVSGWPFKGDCHLLPMEPPSPVLEGWFSGKLASSGSGSMASILNGGGISSTAPDSPMSYLDAYLDGLAASCPALELMLKLDIPDAPSEEPLGISASPSFSGGLASILNAGISGSTATTNKNASPRGAPMGSTKRLFSSMSPHLQVARFAKRELYMIPEDEVAVMPTPSRTLGNKTGKGGVGSLRLTHKLLF